MKKLTSALLLALVFCSLASAQFGGADRIRQKGPTVPTSCADAQIFYRTGATDPGLYVCNGGIYTQVEAPSVGQKNYLTRQYQSKSAKINAGGSSSLVVAVFGDSITANGRYGSPIAEYMKAAYGDGGPGYASFSTHDIVTATNVSRSTSGTWSDLSKTDHVRGIDLSEVTSNAVGASKTLTGPASSIVLYYVGDAAGGSFTYTVAGTGGVGPIAVDTSLTSGVQTIAVSGLALNEYHALTIAVSSAGTSGVTILGADFQFAAPGARVHIIGNSGAKASDYAMADSTAWVASLAAIAPDIVTFYLGANDRSANAVPSQFESDYATIIARIKAAAPLADIVLIGPADSSIPAATYSTADYVASAQKMANASGAVFIDLYKALGPFSDANSRGMYGDSVHLSIDGGMYVASTLLSYIDNPKLAGTGRRLFGASVTSFPNAASGTASYISYTAAGVGDSIRFANVDLGLGFDKAYLEWKRSSSQGRTLYIRTVNSSGVAKNPATFNEDGTSDFTDLHSNTLTVNYVSGITTESIVFQSKLSSWTNPMFSVGANGFLRWGSGSTSAVDTGIGRLAAGVLRVANGSTGYGRIALDNSTPSASTDACTAQSIWADANYVYVCVASGTIKRSALTSW